MAGASGGAPKARFKAVIATTVNTKMTKSAGKAYTLGPAVTSTEASTSMTRGMDKEP